MKSAPQHTPRGLKQITGIEPASSVWETEVMTTILYLHLLINITYLIHIVKV